MQGAAIIIVGRVVGRAPAQVPVELWRTRMEQAKAKQRTVDDRNAEAPNIYYTTAIPAGCGTFWYIKSCRISTINRNQLPGAGRKDYQCPSWLLSGVSRPGLPGLRRSSQNGPHVSIEISH